MSFSSEFDTPENCCVQQFDRPVSVVDTITRTSAPAAPALGSVSIPANITFNPNFGVPITRDIEFVGEKGKNLKGQITVEAVPGSSVGGSLTLLTNGGMSNTPGAGDYVVTFTILPDDDGNIFTPRWAMIAASAGPGEALVFDAANPVTEYAPSNQGVNLTGQLPYSGAWNNNNSNVAAGFGFDASQTFTFRTNGQSGVSSSMRVGIRDVPETYEFYPCDVPRVIDEKLEARGFEDSITDIQAAVDAFIAAPVEAGDFRIGRYDTAFDVNANTVVTGLDLTAARQTRLKILARDAASENPWSISEIDVDSMLARFAAGSTIDAFSHVFDNDYITLNVVDPATGEITFADVGRQMQVAWIELWRAGASGPAIAQASLVGQDGNQANVPLTLASDQVTIGSGLSFTADTIQVDTALRFAEISAFAAYDFDEGNVNQVAEQRVSPILKLEKLRGGASRLLAPASTAYQRHVSGHNDSSNTISWTDLDVQVGDQYRLLSARGATPADVMLITQGQFTVKGSV